MSKGQAFTVDVLLAFVIFVIVLIFFIQVQQDVTRTSFEMHEQFEDMSRLQKVSNALFLQADDSFISIIDETHQYVVVEKLDFLMNQTQNNYSQTKRELGLADIDFFIKAYSYVDSDYVLYNQSGNLTVSNSVYQKEYLFSTENTSSMKIIVGVFT